LVRFVPIPEVASFWRQDRARSNVWVELVRHGKEFLS
jgi:hypothetical protein